MLYCKNHSAENVWNSYKKWEDKSWRKLNTSKIFWVLIVLCFYLGPFILYKILLPLGSYSLVREFPKFSHHACSQSWIPCMPAGTAALFSKVYSYSWPLHVWWVLQPGPMEPFSSIWEIFHDIPRHIFRKLIQTCFSWDSNWHIKPSVLNASPRIWLFWF